MSVAIVKNFNHVEGVSRALELIDEEIKNIVNGRRKFIVKPNFVSSYTYLSATPVEAVEPLLSYIFNKFNVSEILIVESPTVGSLNDAIKNYGYDRLRNLYKVEFIDLENYDYQMVTLVDEHNREYTVYVSKLLMDKNFVRISICRAKTHDTVVVTLSIKNIVVGAIKRSWRHEIHRGYATINYAIAKLATHLMPDLGVIDGVEAMEGNGPISGTVKRWGAVFASINPVNLDAVTAYAMGFDPHDIGYLYLLNKWGYGEIDIDKVNIIGTSIEEVKTRFKPHSTHREQLSWKKHIVKMVELR